MDNDINKRLKSENIIWQLGDLYDGPATPQIDTDLHWCQKEAEALENSYKNRVSELTAGELAKLVARLEKLSTAKGRLSTFAFLYFTTQTQNPEAAALLQKIREASSQTGKHTVFFELEWSAAPTAWADAILDDDKLSPYHHYLATMRRYAPHLLSLPEESLLLEIAPVGRGSWTLLFDKIMGHLKFGARQRTEEEVLTDLYDANREIRQQAADDLTKGLKDNLHIFTHITNNLLADKMIDDRLRHYPDWLSAMNLYNELAGKTVQTLVDAVSGRYDIVSRYYNFKRDLLGLPELTDYDRYAPLPHLPDQEITWPDARDMVLRAFADFSPSMAEIAQMFFQRQWIHAPILAGKRGGAFAHPCTPEVHPYVMVNYTGNMRDISTVAHELGHGVHQYLAAERGYYNSDTPLVLAETASVFAELLLFNYQLNLLEDKRQRAAFIGQKLESIFATVFRQTAMNRFEELSHNARRQHGELGAEEISKLWRSTQEEMFQGSVKLRRDYDIWWSYIPHFLNSPGYVYSYAFGELLVLALYNLYKEQGEAFVPRYIELLKAGGSASPYELLSPFGIDLNDKDFWLGGLTVIEEMVSKLGA
ncbi:MAG: M3 family oligoendopeptidase [Deltaproteobacteria bacterium]|nr:M3 family oligoendopeptidase [Deltaproteobacteria bacterium]